MNHLVPRCMAVLTAIAIGFVASSAFAQHTKRVDGVVVNFGIMPAEAALRAEGHSEAHPQHPPAGSQHVLITLDDEKGARRVGDAEVTVEVKDPRGRMERKPLLHTHGGGLPDYSELFVFSWSGDYDVHVIVVRQPGAKPLEARFTVHHRV